MKQQLLRHYLFLAVGLTAFHMPHAQSMQTDQETALRELLEQHSEKIAQVTPFVHEQLSKAGCSNPESIPVIPFHTFGANSDYGIFVPIHELSTLLKERAERRIETLEDATRFKENLRGNFFLHLVYGELPKDKDFFQNVAALKEFVEQRLEYRINNVIGTLHHEAAHYKNNDSYKKKRFDGNLSKATTVMAVGTMVVCAIRLYLLDNQQWQNRCVHFAGATILSRFLAPAISNTYSRELEWRADESIPNETKILRARAQHFEVDDKSARRRRKEMFYKDAMIDLKNTAPIVNAVLSTHPRHKLRELRFIERAEAVEQGKPIPARSRFRSCVIS
ncbi:hypothetical protein JST99_00260 [Candidatus Dependentiae bacterium]|nr:hypothetical protein [Candidatus Dependentiae bacterium]MCC7415465.1 hypothetical protein [Campylobacterota bacterium]